MSSKSQRVPRRTPVSAPAPRWETAAAVAMGATVFLSLTLVDSSAEASFEAPKRAVAMLGVAISAVAILAGGPWPATRRTMLHNLAAVASGLALLGMIASAVVSEHRAIAFDTARGIVLLAVASAVSASSPRVFRAAVNGFVAGCALNAALALMQFAGLRLFDYAATGGRSTASALIGNDGLLAILLAFALVIVIHRILVRDQRATWIDWSLLLLLGGGLAINISLTAVTVVGAGTLALLRHAPRKVLLALGAAALALLVALLLFPATRLRIAEIAEHVNSGRWDRATSYRLAPWSAAVEMIRSKPVLGHGAGTYGAEYIPHVASAQLRWRQRFVNPILTGSYVQAHNDWLQAAAEWGTLSVISIAVALASLVALLFRSKGKRHDVVLVGALLASTVAASMTWFAMHVPSLALLSLAAAGRGWRATAEGDE